MMRTQIARRLARLKKRYPKITKLVSCLEKDFYPTKSFMDAYFSSNIKYVIKSLVLRIILEDPILFTKDRELVITPDLLKKINYFFINHPKSPLDPFRSRFTHGDLPGHLSRIFGTTRGNMPDLISRYALIPHYEMNYNKKNKYSYPIPVNGKLSKQLFKPIFDAHILTHQQALDIIFNQKRINPNILRFFFATALSPLNFRNALFFSKVLLNQNRMGGKIQNSLPTAVSKLFGISRCNIPQLLIYLDLLALKHQGLIDIASVPKSKDFLDLRKDWNKILDVDAILSLHAQRLFLIKPEDADIFYQNKNAGMHGQFETSIYFNLSRLLKSNKYSRFGIYYDVIDDELLIRYIASLHGKSNTSHKRRFLKGCKSYPNLFAGAHIRDISNCLTYADYLDSILMPARQYLPPVAKYSLGLKEPQRSLTPQKKTSSKRSNKFTKPRQTDTLPLLDALS